MKLISPEWGGGAIVSLLDKDGKEVYNSGFVQNDLTDEGIWHLVSSFATGGTNSNSHAGKNLIFMWHPTHPTYSVNINISLKGPSSTVKSPTLRTTQNASGALNRVFGSPYKKIDDKIYIGNSWKVTFPFGAVVDSISEISLLAQDVERSTIILPSPIQVNALEQVIVEYFRFSEISDYYSVISDELVRNPSVHVEDFSEGRVHFNPIHFQENSFGVSVMAHGNMAQNIVTILDADREVIGSTIISDSINNSHFSSNRGDLSASLHYDFHLSPSQVEFEDAKYITIIPVTGRSSPQIFCDPTIEFHQPISKSSRDRLHIKFSITLKGGRDSLDLTDVLPHIIESQ